MATTHQPPVPTEYLDGAVEDYPSDARYWIVAGILAVFTAAEVVVYEAIADPTAMIPILLGLMAAKFVLVAAVFMHLWFDKRILTVAFYAGIVFALALYLCTLAAFRWFGDDSAIVAPT